MKLIKTNKGTFEVVKQLDDVHFILRKLFTLDDKLFVLKPGEYTYAS